MKAVFTVGHSTRSLEQLVELLQAFRVRQLVDVRTIPRSRTNPQFNKETLGPFLRGRGVNYRHVKDLGGLRRPRPGSEANRGWRNASFRGYADYMQTPEFEAALGRLLAIAGRRLTAVMCAEAVPWRCHRSLIADALAARGVDVRHIMTASSAKPHRLSAMAKVSGTRLTYPYSKWASPAARLAHTPRMHAGQKNY